MIVHSAATAVLLWLVVAMLRHRGLSWAGIAWELLLLFVLIAAAIGLVTLVEWVA